MSKNEEEVDETLEETQEEETEEETTDWESKFNESEAKRKEAEGRSKRAETKLSKAKKTETPKSDELDYGKKAFLVANDIKGEKETALVEEIMKATGKTIEQVLETKYFKAELDEMRALKETEDALPKGSKKGTNSSQDSVEYWISKGELPKDRELRQKVVNARIDREKGKSVFE